MSAVVRDEFSNVIPTCPIEPDGTCRRLASRPSPARRRSPPHRVISGFEKVGNVPGPLTTIQVTSSAGAIAPPAPTGLMSDYTPNPSKPTSKTFVSAAGYDFYGNYTGDMTGSTTFTISPDRSCAAAACSGALPGVHTVTGTLGANSDTESLTVDAYSDSYSMTCRGGWFDINGAMGDGCEKSTIWAPNSNRVTARSLASYDDCTENQGPCVGELFSEHRVHTPTDPEFNHSAGFEPLWFRTSADDTIGCLTNTADVAERVCVGQSFLLLDDRHQHSEDEPEWQPVHRHHISGRRCCGNRLRQRHVLLFQDREDLFGGFGRRRGSLLGARRVLAVNRRGAGAGGPRPSP